MTEARSQLGWNINTIAIITMARGHAGMEDERKLAESPNSYLSATDEWAPC